MIYVALDIGNVLVHSNFQDFIKRLSKALNITIEEANYFMNRTQKLHDLGLTVMADELRDHFKLRSQVTIDELIQDWNDVIQPADYIIDALHEIPDLKVALLSNVGLEHSARMGEILKHDGFFEEAVKHFSCHVGARKPSALYYHTFLQLHPQWQDCVYIDDLQENLDSSKQFGFKTFRFALEEVTGDNYEESKYENKIKDMQDFIRSSKQSKKNPRWH